MQRRSTLALCLLALTCSAFAQSDRGTLTGTVSDPQGAVVPNAEVKARNAATAAEYVTVATGTGNYTLPQLPAGTYDLTVTAVGFKVYEQKGVTIQSAQSERVDFVLQVGAATERVTVTAEATLLKTENAEQSSNITAERMNQLPLNFAGLGTGNVRNPYVFMNLTPGAAFTATGNTFYVRVNGAPANSETIRVEGMEADNTLQPGSPHQTQVSVEAMQEVSVQTSNFAAEYGQVSGGLFNFTMRSGTNQYHGSLYDYFTNEDLNAGIPFTDSGHGHLLRPPTHKNDFGGSVGGPVRIPKVYDGRNKTFFFFNWESYIQRTTTVGGIFTVPTDAMRKGDFSSILTNRTLATDPLGRAIQENVIYDPMTEQTVSGRIVRDPFPGNTIPANRMDPVALKVQSFIPAPQTGGNTNNWTQVYASPRTQWIPSLKVDHNFSDKLKASFFWSYYNDNHYSGQDGYNPPMTATRYIPIRSQTYRIAFDQSVTPTLLLHYGLGEVFYHNPDTGVNDVLGFDAPAQLGLVGGLPNSTGKTGFPRINGLSSSFGGLSLSLGPTNNGYYRTDKPGGVVSATWVHNTHTYKAGAEYRKDIYSNLAFSGSFGTWNFSSAQTGLPSTNGQNLSGGGVGFPYASFLLGQVSSASVSSGQFPQMRKQSWGLFVQDNWKITHRLTLDYGLRWDWQEPPYEIHDLLSMFSPTTPNPSAGGLPGGTAYSGYGPGRCNCRFMHPYMYAFGPRIGVAYQLTSKTVIRAGWGMTYGSTPAWNFIGNTVQLGLGVNTYSLTSPAFDEPAVQFSAGLHYDLASLYRLNLNPGLRPDPGQLNAPNAMIDPQGGRPPRINQWNVSLQRSITSNLLAEAAYVGNRGVWETAPALVPMNVLTSQRLAAFGIDPNSATDRALLSSTFASGQPQARGFSVPYAGFPTTSTLEQALRPFPQFSSSLTPMYSPVGNSWYDALQVKLTKRTSHGLTGSLAFTWQKELDLGATIQDGTGGAINDALNRSVNKDLSSFSQPFVLVPTINYEFPGVGPKFLRAITGGWEIGAILRYASGLPIQVPTAQNNLNSVFFQGTFVNRIPGVPLFTKDPNCHCIDPNKDFVLNPAAWSQPAAGQWGTAAAFYNDYRWQRRYDEQASLGRIFHIKERVALQVRAEFFNVLNRMYLNGPSSGNSLAAQVRSNQGVATSGFGYVNPGSTAVSPRTGQLVARIQW